MYEIQDLDQPAVHCMFLARSGREASTEFEPCWPGKGYSPYRTGQHIFLYLFVLDVLDVGYPAEA